MSCVTHFAVSCTFYCANFPSTLFMLFSEPRCIPCVLCHTSYCVAPLTTPRTSYCANFLSKTALCFLCAPCPVLHVLALHRLILFVSRVLCRTFTISLPHFYRVTPFYRAIFCEAAFHSTGFFASSKRIRNAAKSARKVRQTVFL